MLAAGRLAHREVTALDLDNVQRPAFELRRHEPDLIAAAQEHGVQATASRTVEDLLTDPRFGAYKADLLGQIREEAGRAQAAITAAELAAH
jgi:hypothetical protein